ncbi:glycosyltransferase family 2 protein [Nitrospira sp. M1]
MEQVDLGNQYPAVTVGTLNRDGIERLRISIPTMQSLDYPSLEFVVIDGGSTDGSVEYLQQFPNIRVVNLEGTFSVTKGRNRLVRAAKTPYVFMVDNDIEILDPQLLKALYARYQQYPDLAFLSPLVLDADTEMLSEVGLSHTHIQHKQPLTTVLGHGPIEVSGYYGNCVLFRAQLLEDLGAHDERYPYHNNDYDLGARAYLKGFRVMIETDQYVIHHGYAARVQLSPVTWRYQYHLSSMGRIICKNYRFKNLLIWLPATMGWTFIKALRLSWKNRSPRPFLSTCKSLFYFLRDLPDTWKVRKRIQQERVASEDYFLKIPPARF